MDSKDAILEAKESLNEDNPNRESEIESLISGIDSIEEEENGTGKDLPENVERGGRRDKEVTPTEKKLSKIDSDAVLREAMDDEPHAPEKTSPAQSGKTQQADATQRYRDWKWGRVRDFVFDVVFS